MRLNNAFLVHNTDDESVLVPTADAAFSGIVRGNSTLGAVLELLESDIAEEEIVATLRARYDAPAGAVERDVSKVLSELRRIGALDE